MLMHHRLQIQLVAVFSRVSPLSNPDSMEWLFHISLQISKKVVTIQPSPLCHPVSRAFLYLTQIYFIFEAM